MNIVEQQKNYYEKYWENGRNHFSGSKQGYARNFRDWMHKELKDLAPASQILEVGCGDASFTTCLAEYSQSVTAIDISERQIEENSGRYPEIHFLQHDVAEPLPFANESFDVIWCSEVLEHLFAPDFALKEIFRVLTPRGRLLVTVPYHGGMKNVLIALFKWNEHFTPSNPHIRFFTRDTLTKIAADAGFQKIRTSTCGMDRPLRDLFVATNLLLAARKP